MKVILDRRENDKAILEIPQDRYKIIVPEYVLPASAKEGDVLTLEIKKTRQTQRETQEKKEKSRSLLNRLFLRAKPKSKSKYKYKSKKS